MIYGNVIPVVCDVCRADCILTPGPGRTMVCPKGCDEPVEAHSIPLQLSGVILCGPREVNGPRRRRS